MPDLSNLYGPYDPTSHKQIKGHITFNDWKYLKQHYPMLNGLFSGLVSSFFHRFIQHYRSLEKSNVEPFEPAWYPGCPGYILLDLIIERCNFDDVTELKRELARVTAENIELRHELQRNALGRTPGTVTGTHDVGTTGSVCSEVQCPEVQRPDPQGRAHEGCHEAGSD